MNSLPNDISNLIGNALHGDKSYWKSKFQDVLHDIKNFNADYIVSHYFNDDNIRYKDIYIDIMNFWFHIGEHNKFKQYLINKTLHVLKSKNHHFYDIIEYHLLYDLGV